MISLYIAAGLAITIGIAHSWLGERLILMRLFRRSTLPPLFGGEEFTRNTLRFAWHVTSIAWWGFAALLIVMAGGPPALQTLGIIIGATFLVHSLLTLVASRGRHFAWPVFLAIGVLAIYATSG